MLGEMLLDVGRDVVGVGRDDVDVCIDDVQREELLNPTQMTLMTLKREAHWRDLLDDT